MNYIKLIYELITCKNLKREKEILHLDLPNLLTERRLKRGEQTNCLYCSKCGLELTSTSWIGNFKGHEHSYCCDNCADVSTYDFGIAPCPIKVESHLD